MAVLSRRRFGLCVFAAPAGLALEKVSLMLAIVACTPPRPAEPVGETRPPLSRESASATPAGRAAFAAFVLPEGESAPRDVTNRFADDPRAAALGQRLFFDPRFSGPLLDVGNTGGSGTLGKQGETGKVACASCHMPQNRAFLDTRSPRRQLSFASGWTRRRAPSLLDVRQVRLLMWDGSRDTFFGQVFVPIESPVELNSSRSFVAAQLARFYRDEYEALFGALEPGAGSVELQPADAGCDHIPRDPQHPPCRKPGDDAEPVVRAVVNFGKAIQAYLRRLSCGRSRFDAWVEGADSALDADERAGASLFLGKAGCAGCHAGPHFTDRRFHNVGLQGRIIPFTGVDSARDRGAALGLATLKDNPLGSRGPYSDGYDGRLDALPSDLSALTGAFRTPSLRCVSRRPSFMHDGQYRDLLEVLRFFNRGGGKKGFVGTAELVPRGLDEVELRQLLAFLRSLDGTGPEPELVREPVTQPSAATTVE